MKTIFLTFHAFLVVFGYAHSAIADVPESKIVYSVGEERLYSPGGDTYYGSRKLLAKTTYSPETNAIIEDVLSIDPNRGKENFEVNFLVTGNTFTCADSLKTYTCEGNLVGDNWQWTGWNFKVKLADGQGYIEVSEVFKEKEFIGEKRFFNSQGQHQLDMKVDMKKISKENYDLLLKEWSTPDSSR